MAERPPSDNPRPAPPTAPPAPELYQDRYELGPVLGKGGTCTVYRAWDTRLQRYVAIKRLLPPLSEDPHARTRFNREGRAIARLSHPNLVTLIDRGSTETEEYLVFEYVEGRSLKELVKSSGFLDIRDACHIAGQVAEGLAQAHLAGIVHRDVKPQNILLDAEGRAKLTDFGIATGPDWTKVTRAGTIVGSSRYMSPEQVQSRPVDVRSDIYSLGIVLYEMLGGRPPFDGASIAEIGRLHVKQRAVSLKEERPEVPDQLDKVVLRCLEKLPENRFQSMDELLGALVALDLYSLERAPGGLLEGLRRRALPRREGATDPNLWVPPPGSEVQEQVHPGEQVDAARGRVRRAEVMRRRRATSRRSFRPLLLGALGLAILAIGVFSWLLFSSSAVAPALVGKSLDQAQQLAGEAGLTLEVDSEQIPSFEQAGLVQEQDPLQGEEAADGVVRVRVSRTWLAIQEVTLDDSDPGGDGHERPELLPQLRDGDPGTGWSTELYKSSANLGNLKEGVGVAFELAEAAGLVRITSPNEGWKGELQARQKDGTYLKVADLSGMKEQQIALERPLAAGRLWITALVPAQDEYFSVELSELGFFR